MDELICGYKGLEDIISFEEFKDKVKEKIDLMGGLCDEKTAAMLVAKDFGVESKVKIKDISSDKGDVSFTGKVTQIDKPREFSRDDGTIGRVSNLTISDDTGSVRLVLWDDESDLVKVGKIKTGTVLKVKGYVKEGFFGVEVNIGRNGGLDFINEDIAIKRYKISEILAEMNAINISGVVLDSGEVRTFKRKDGSSGMVKNLSMGDETGKIRISLWDEWTSEKFNVGDVARITNGYSKESFGATEVHVGRRGNIKVSKEKVLYNERITKITDIGLNEACSVIGRITGIDTIREFVKRDGNMGKVANVYVTDDTGRIKVALWDNHTELIERIDVGSLVKVVDGYAKTGFNDEMELSVGWRGRTELLE